MLAVTQESGNVSLFWYRPSSAASATVGFPVLHATITLVSPDPAKAADFRRELTLARNVPAYETGTWGWATWMTTEQFQNYVKEGIFEVGFNATIVP